MESFGAATNVSKKKVQAEREAEQARAEALAEGKEMPEEDTKETSNSVQDDTFLDEGRKAPKVRRYNFFKDESGKYLLC